MAWQDDPLVGTRPKWESDPIIDSAPVLLAAVPASPAIEFGAGKPPLQALQSSLNPYSAGLYPLGRKYSVGDEATFREADLLTDVEQRLYTQRVTRVDEEADRVEINDGSEIWDLMGNWIKWGNLGVFDTPAQFSPAELQVGKRWTAAYMTARDGQRWFTSIDFRIVSRALVKVPAGSLDAFYIDGHGTVQTGGRAEVRLWLVPRLNFPVRVELVRRNRAGALARTDRHELVSLRQQAVER